MRRNQCAASCAPEPGSPGSPGSGQPIATEELGRVRSPLPLGSSRATFLSRRIGGVPLGSTFRFSLRFRAHVKMPAVSQLHKWTLGLGAVSGALLYYYNARHGNANPLQVHNSWTTNYTPSVKWDHNWDRRDPKSLVKPIKINDENDENKANEKYEAKKAKAVRHILLIRHGQYHTDGKTDAERVLTELGRKQAEATGKRLAELNLPYSSIVRSTMTRALETSKIIEKNLINVPVEDDCLLVEGAPIPPEPPIGQWKSEKHFFQDGPRIEAAFRKYFHRADPSLHHDSYTVLVCHANVIRYFVCRALQFPPEAWLRICLKHGSITWLCILPNGRVTLFCLGDTGHMPPQNITSS